LLPSWTLLRQGCDVITIVIAQSLLHHLPIAAAAKRPVPSLHQTRHLSLELFIVPPLHLHPVRDSDDLLVPPCHFVFVAIIVVIIVSVSASRALSGKVDSNSNDG